MNLAPMSKQKKLHAFFAVFFPAFTLFSLGNLSFAGEIPTLAYSVLRTLPHEERHFTQGLVFRKNRLFESAGGYGRSSVHEKELLGGKPLRSLKLPPDFFAEGLTQIGSELFLLSWRNGFGIVFDPSLRERRRFNYSGEGWGLSDDGRQLIMSDGSNVLRWLDPVSAQVTRRLAVLAGRSPVSQLNELEYARGLIYANLWHSDRIAVIHPHDGQVRAWLDLATLRQNLRRPAQWNEQEHVLNGIAYDSQRDLFYVTGKCWPVMYELRIAALRKNR